MVVQKLVSPGLVIQAGTTACFMISDVSTVWVQGHIFDRDLPSVRVGDTRGGNQSRPSPQTFHGVVSYIGAMVDPATRTTPVRIVTQNPRGLLKKDMFVDAVIHTRTQKNVLAVPVVGHSAQRRKTSRSSTSRSQPGKFAQRLVTIGAQQNDETEILSGLKEGENDCRRRQRLSPVRQQHTSKRPSHDCPHRFFRPFAAVRDRHGFAAC